MSSGRGCLLDIGVILSFMEFERSRVRIDLGLKGENGGSDAARQGGRKGPWRFGLTSPAVSTIRTSDSKGGASAVIRTKTNPAAGQILSRIKTPYNLIRTHVILIRSHVI